MKDDRSAISSETQSLRPSPALSSLPGTTPYMQSPPFNGQGMQMYMYGQMGMPYRPGAMGGPEQGSPAYFGVSGMPGQSPSSGSSMFAERQMSHGMQMQQQGGPGGPGGGPQGMYMPYPQMYSDNYSQNMHYRGAPMYPSDRVMYPHLSPMSMYSPMMSSSTMDMYGRPMQSHMMVRNTFHPSFITLFPAVHHLFMRDICRVPPL
jgi:hypothetical protein